jgi:hypothetical protein
MIARAPVTTVRRAWILIVAVHVAARIGFVGACPVVATVIGTLIVIVAIHVAARIWIWFIHARSVHATVIGTLFVVIAIQAQTGIAQTGISAHRIARVGVFAAWIHNLVLAQAVDARIRGAGIGVTAVSQRVPAVSVLAFVLCAGIAVVRAGVAGFGVMKARSGSVGASVMRTRLSVITIHAAAVTRSAASAAGIQHDENPDFVVGLFLRYHNRIGIDGLYSRIIPAASARRFPIGQSCRTR